MPAMSAASKKNDPFNFDEIYKQAGVSDLFVKKSMGELKQRPSAMPVPSTSPMWPAAAPSATKPDLNTVSMDLDFLAAMAAPSASSQSLSKHGSSSILAAQQQLQHPIPKPGGPAPPPRKVLDDPFALFEEVPGAAPPQKHLIQPTPPVIGNVNTLLDFDDGHAFSPHPAAPSSTPPTLLPQTARPPTSTQFIQPPSPPSSHVATMAGSASGLVAPETSSPPPPAYSFHAEHRLAPPGIMTGPHSTTIPGAAFAGHPPTSPVRPPSFVTPVGYSGAMPASTGFDAAAAAYYTSPLHSPPHLPTPHPAPPPQQYYNMVDGPESSQPSNSSTSLTWHHTPSGSGISGYLKAMGKKAVRAAKAGLTQLENALEGLDQPLSHSHAHRETELRPPISYVVDRGRSDTEGTANVNSDEALAWALRLLDLTPNEQQQELSHMAPPLRRKVIGVLREQASSEHEALPAAVAVPSTAGSRGGPGYGASSPPLEKPGFEDGTLLGQPSGRASDGGGSGAAVQHPPASSEPVQHSHRSQRSAAIQPPLPSADLLGISSDEPPIRVQSSAPAAAAIAVSAAPAVDDLLGMGDGPLTAGPTVTVATAAATPSSSAQPLAPKPVPQAAVHVDDIDDFFSGGKSVGSGGASAGGSGLAMHGSSSAPNLRTAHPGGGGGGEGSNRAAALADMLHGSNDERGGADVDVTDYADLYKGEQGAVDEPEIRRQLRTQREAAKHARMKGALAEKLAMEAEEAARREQQVQLKDQYKAEIEKWKNKNKGNIRGLLGSLHTVVWPDSGWTPVSVGDLLEPGQVKRVYMRANLLVHPDKVRQRNGSADQVAIADMVFDVLKDAWNVFR